MNSLERFVRFLILTAFLMLVCEIPYYLAARNSHKSVIDDLVELKDFKKLLRTKNNVLVCFVSSAKSNQNIIKVFEESADLIKGQGTMVMIDCSAEAKKLCKKLKVTPDSYVLKHYKDGEFHKNYDRRETVSSILNFMRDPTGDVPWDEDPMANGIIHIPDAVALTKLLRKELGPVMVMFYAPWCGFCKQLKPEYSAAALELKGHSTLAAIDVNRPENAIVRTQYNITGFPTLVYFQNGVKKFNYEGDNNKKSIIEFMKNPSAAPAQPVQSEWSSVESDVVHLTDDTFNDVVAKAESILVMFYAPWCGHCKRLKPEYEKAAENMKRYKVSGALAALDATKEQKTAKAFDINGYPTLKYFRNGDFQFDISLRDEAKIVDFMRNPKEPPPPPPPEKPWHEEKSEVVHLTADTFKPFLKKKKHVLVMFYAPWCGHCKKAKPEFTAAAENFKDDSKIELAALDCTAHSAVCSAYQVKGYPTIRLFHYLNKEPVQEYTGGRTSRDFTSFMATFAAQNKERKEEEIGNKKSDVENSNLIIHSTEENVDAIIKRHDSVLVFFHTVGCDNCQEIKEIFLDSASRLKKQNIEVKLVLVEKSDKSFSTIKYYEKGNFVRDLGAKVTSQQIMALLSKTPKKDEF